MDADVLLILPAHAVAEWKRQRKLNGLLERALQLACQEFRKGPITEEGWFVRLLSEAATQLGDDLPPEHVDALAALMTLPTDPLDA
jgi:hypothetical protein